MAKKSKSTKHKHTTLIIILASALALSAIFLGWAVYDTRPPKIKLGPLPNHTMPYVDGDAAVQQVESFYKNYTKPSLESKKDKIIEIFGSDNLEFYYEYYRHGFDPITCSTSVPTKLSHSLRSTGPVATINTSAEYEDGSTATIQSRVVLSDDGMDVDSVSCPGEKGNLPPQNTQ